MFKPINSFLILKMVSLGQFSDIAGKLTIYYLFTYLFLSLFLCLFVFIYLCTVNIVNKKFVQMEGISHSAVRYISEKHKHKREFRYPAER